MLLLSFYPYLMNDKDRMIANANNVSSDAPRMNSHYMMDKLVETAGKLSLLKNLSSKVLIKICL